MQYITCTSANQCNRNNGVGSKKLPPSQTLYYESYRDEVAAVGNQLRVIYQLQTSESSAVHDDIVLSHELETQTTETWLINKLTIMCKNTEIQATYYYYYY